MCNYSIMQLIYQKANYVQKRKIASILFSNIVIQADLSVSVYVKPPLQKLFSRLVEMRGFEPLSERHTFLALPLQSLIAESCDRNSEPSRSDTRWGFFSDRFLNLSAWKVRARSAARPGPRSYSARLRCRRRLLELS